MSRVADELERLGSIPRAEIMSRAGAWDEVRAGIALAVQELRSPGLRQTSPEVSSLAAQVLNGHEPSREEILSLAGSCLAQDERPGQDHPLLPLDDPQAATARNLAAAQLQGQAHPIVEVVEADSQAPHDPHFGEGN